MKRLTVFLLTLAACAQTQRPAPKATSTPNAPSLAGAAVLVLPVQGGTIPGADATMHHWPADRTALDAEIAYWLKQNSKTRWFLSDQIDRALERSPGLDVQPRQMAVGIFQRGMVERIGDPLFGDIRKLAAVFDANIALLPVGAEYVGATRETAKLQIATALVAMDADVKWFGIIEGTEPGVDSQAAVASAAQAFARAFGDKKRIGEE